MKPVWRPGNSTVACAKTRLVCGCVWVWGWGVGVPHLDRFPITPDKAFSITFPAKMNFLAHPRFGDGQFYPEPAGPPSVRELL